MIYDPKDYNWEQHKKDLQESVQTGVDPYKRTIQDVYNDGMMTLMCFLDDKAETDADVVAGVAKNFDEANVKRGKTVDGTNSGSFAPENSSGQNGGGVVNDGHGQSQENIGGHDAVRGFRVESPERRRDFYDSLVQANAGHKFGAAVEVKDLAFYQDPGTKLFLAPDSTADVAVNSVGDLVSVFKQPGSQARIKPILAEAAEHAQTLDCYDSDGKLPNLYAEVGFQPVAALKFNRQFAPAGWPYELAGEPNIVFMVKDTSGVLGGPKIANRNYDAIKGQIPVFTDYDQAKAAQLAAKERVANGGVMKSDADIVKAFVEKADTDGEWKTIRGRRVQIKDGETPTQAVARDIKEQGANPSGGAATPQSTQAVTPGQGLSELMGANPSPASPQPVEQPKPANLTESPGFKKWFGESKVVDASGKPQVVYHGTTSPEFTEFKHRLRGPGFWFADKGDPSLSGASFYAGKGGRTIPVYLSLQNPAPTKVFVAAENAAERRAPRGADHYKFIDKAVREKLIKQGYDGVRVDGKDEAGKKVLEWIAFHPNQIKHAEKNSGTFDAKSTDITKAFDENQPRGEHGQWTHVTTTSNATHEAVLERGKFMADKPEVNRLTIRPIGGAGGDVYHLMDHQEPSIYAEGLLSAAKIRADSASHKKEVMEQLNPQIESVTFKKPLRKTHTVLLKISNESERFLSGRECDNKGIHFGQERTIEKKHIKLRKAIPVRYNQTTPMPVAIPVPDQLRHFAGTSDDSPQQGLPHVPDDLIGRFPTDPTLRELRTPDRSAYEQGASHNFKEEYIRNDIRGADKRKQDLPGDIGKSDAVVIDEFISKDAEFEKEHPRDHGEFTPKRWQRDSR
jgi:ADP-Ribosyltransferase in polyvalent proteins